MELLAVLAIVGMLARVDDDEDDGSAAADGRLSLARPTQLCSCLS